MNLKRIILILLLSIGLNTTAQNEFKFGAKAGFNYSGFNVNGSSSYSDGYGYQFGIIGEYKFSNSFSLQPEVIYILKKGGRGTPSAFFPRGLITSELTYIDIPINGKYYFFKGFAAEFGPQLDILINEETSIDFYDDSQSGSFVNFETNGIQFSLNLGISYLITDKYLLQFRYSYGLSNVYKDLEAKNTVFAFSVGYFFL